MVTRLESMVNDKMSQWELEAMIGAKRAVVVVGLDDDDFPFEISELMGLAVDVLGGEGGGQFKERE